MRRPGRRVIGRARLAVWLAALLTSPCLAVNDLSLTVAPGSTAVRPGDTVTVTLNVANLTTAINGLQVLVRYDPAILSLTGIAPTNLGLVPPAAGWVQVAFADSTGDVTYAAVINGGSTTAAGTVATLTFTAIGQGVTNVTFRPDNPPFLTKLTAAADNATILPVKSGSGTITSTCDDGEFCTGVEGFSGGACVPGSPPDCSPLTNACNVGVCDETNDVCRPQPTNEGGPCNDFNLCTLSDTCTAGACSGTPVDCSALSNACNVGTCNGTSGLCQAVPANQGGSCNDGVFCNGPDTCNGGACVSSGDPCTPLVCDEGTDVCLGPVHVRNLEVFYAGKFSNQADATKTFLAPGSTATVQNITNYDYGITGLRITFDNAVSFAATPAAAFSFRWTTGTGTTFSALSDVTTAVTVSPALVGAETVVDIVLADDHVRRRWLEVRIHAAQVTVTGVALDGELVGNPVALPSGNGTPGGDSIFYFGNMPGDVTFDRRATLTDVGQIRLQVNPALPVPIGNLYDVDKSARVRLADAGLARLDVNPAVILPLISP